MLMLKMANGNQFSWDLFLHSPAGFGYFRHFRELRCNILSHYNTLHSLDNELKCAWQIQKNWGILVQSQLYTGQTHNRVD